MGVSPPHLEPDIAAQVPAASGTLHEPTSIRNDSNSELEIDLRATNTKGHPQITKSKKQVVREKHMDMTQDIVNRAANGEAPLTLREFRQMMST